MDGCHANRVSLCEASQKGGYYELDAEKAAIVREIVALYIGTVYWGKPERQTSPSNPDKKTAWRRKAPETWQAIPVPPVIDESLFQMAQARKRRNLQAKPRNKKHEYRLSNARLRCGDCGYVMAGNYLSRRHFRFYRCCRPKHVAGPCKGYVAAEKVERKVWQVVERA
jgi:site-specific DNA recombinase